MKQVLLETVVARVEALLRLLTSFLTTGPRFQGHLAAQTKKQPDSTEADGYPFFGSWWKLKSRKMGLVMVLKREAPQVVDGLERNSLW
ncbi:hypothetical protein CVT25_015553 [Psilocybe cyanescens]|uniref:Uncharacterized protein n=1 Tax=Psilocybe cyanescens TaxID=93625 RepID=A0A409WI83_PSICY|nr:hypothetical protein CVT25_015553 [Psilocybe cyanescens]